MFYNRREKIYFFFENASLTDIRFTLMPTVVKHFVRTVTNLSMTISVIVAILSIAIARIDGSNLNNLAVVLSVSTLIYMIMKPLCGKEIDKSDFFTESDASFKILFGNLVFRKVVNSPRAKKWLVIDASKKIMQANDIHISRILNSMCSDYFSSCIKLNDHANSGSKEASDAIRTMSDRLVEKIIHEIDLQEQRDQIKKKSEETAKWDRATYLENKKKQTIRTDITNTLMD